MLEIGIGGRERDAVVRSYAIAGIDVAIEAPPAVAAVLARMIPRQRADGSARVIRGGITVAVAERREMWRIAEARTGLMSELKTSTALPDVADAACAAAAGAAADLFGGSHVHGFVIEKGPLNLALAAGDLDRALLVAVHLIARGWSMVANIEVLASPQARTVEPYHKLLSIPAGMLASLPLVLRRPVEASPWYVGTGGIRFYAVDPAAAVGPQAWSTAGVDVRAALTIDEVSHPVPVILAERRPQSIFSDAREGHLFAGPPIATADAVETWVAECA
ncbi:MAG: hypothetical protein ACREM6_07130 [Vulcanimicrobiaceae bacterium]